MYAHLVTPQSTRTSTGNSVPPADLADLGGSAGDSESVNPGHQRCYVTG